MKNVKAGHTHPIVCQDAGHYGSKYNPGAVTGYYESEMAWKLTQLEKIELERFGIEVWQTRRTQSQNPELTARGRMSAGADLFYSNHSNACGTERVDRVECIHLVDDNCGAVDEQSRQIAELLAKTVSQTMGTKDAPKVYSLLSGKDRDGDGKKNDDHYGVLHGAHQVGTPAVIVEHSFHTNVAAARWLSEDTNLKLLAAAKAKVIAEWFGIAGAAVTTAATEAARAYDKSLYGVYKTTCKFNVRNGAGTTANRFGEDKNVLITLPKGAKVRCLGAHTDVNGTRWLYVHFVRKGITYTGFASSRYLERG